MNEGEEPWVNVNLSELTAYVALIADEAERRFGANRYSVWHDAYAREAALDLWLTRPGVTVSIADRVWRLVRGELRRRSPNGDRRKWHDAPRHEVIRSGV